MSAVVKKPGRFYGVGAGPGDPRLLTLRAVEVLKTVDVIFHATGANSAESVSGRIVASVKGCKARQVQLVFSMAPALKAREAAWLKNADLIAVELNAGRSAAFVTIGDPMIYSTYTYLAREVRRRVPAVDIETVPGITSFQAAAARANLPLVEDRDVLVVIPAWTEDGAAHPALGVADTAVLMKTYRHRNRILEQVKAQGMATGLYAVKVGHADEAIIDDLDAVRDRPEEYLSLMIVKKMKAGRL